MSDKQGGSDSRQALVDMLGYDPAKQGVAGSTMMNEVIAELNEERSKKKKAKAKEDFIALEGLVQKWAETEKAFFKAKQKFQKEIDKGMANIRRQFNDGPPSSTNDDGPVVLSPADNSGETD